MFIRYHNLFNRNKSAKDFYFTNKKGTPLTSSWVYKVYRQLLCKPTANGVFTKVIS
jgi:hypothetical protein